jgi:pyruvate/2-oxoacid:ferredoxin oxidoreductase alpha subunit
VLHVFESGNTAAAIGVRLSRAQVIAAYPITPQTPLTEKLSEYIESGEMNAQYVPVESEHSAMAVCIAASSAGARAFTATSANGLLYMHEQIHWAAGARLPIVMCVVNRGVGAPWNIWNDHQDSMSQRDTGWIQLYASDHQQIIDTVIKAFWIAENISIPVMVCYDGYILSHAFMPFEVPDLKLVDKFLPQYRPAYSLDPESPANLNTVTLPDPRENIHGKLAHGYMELRCILQEDMRSALGSISSAEKKFMEIFGRGGNPFHEAYRCDDADIIAVSIGSLSYQLRDAADLLRETGIRIGVLGIKVYRPFPDEAIAGMLAGASSVIVIEKALSYGYQGPVCADIRSALYRFGRKAPAVHNVIAGLGGRDIKTFELIDVIKNISGNPEMESNGIKWMGLKL